jgi:kynurenine formamidase
MTIDFDKLPTFADLPVRTGVPADCAWGVFGDDDEIGTVNLLTAEALVAAAKLVRKGAIFRLDTPINYAFPPFFGRDPADHRVVQLGKYEFAQDDLLDNYNTQQGTQWDGLGHVAYAPTGEFYNGVQKSEVHAGPGGRLGIERWHDRIAGRGVLLDLDRFRAGLGTQVDYGARDEYTVEDLEGARQAQGVEFHGGDILLVRTGWLGHYLRLPQSERDTMGTGDGLVTCGIENSRAVAEWLWDNRIAMLGTDNPAVETWPWNDFESTALHFRVLALLGLPLGEQFVLDDLAADCFDDGVYEFLLTSAPLVLVGGVASPPNALAIK